MQPRRLHLGGRIPPLFLSAPESGVGDLVHRWTAPIHEALVANPQAANALLVISSAVIDVVGVSLLAAAIFGRTIRPFLGLLMLFALRQICQGLCALPVPPEMIWHATGVPTLLVTYGVSTDLFFSGHTGLAVLGAAEMIRCRPKGLAFLGILIALFEAATVLADSGTTTPAATIASPSTNTVGRSSRRSPSNTRAEHNASTLPPHPV